LDIKETNKINYKWIEIFLGTTKSQKTYRKHTKYKLLKEQRNNDNNNDNDNDKNTKNGNKDTKTKRKRK